MTPVRIVAGAMAASALSGAALAQVGTDFTYQGQLRNSNAPATGLHDLRFTLWTDPTDPNSPIGPVVCKDGVNIADGLFTVQLDFGPNVFTGFALWLGIEVRADATPGNCGSGAFRPLAPRQPLTPTPYAIHATTAGTAGLSIPFSGAASLAIPALLELDNTRTTGNTVTGVFWNRSAGNDSRALTGLATAASGTTYGVYGDSNSSAGIGVYGESAGNIGVMGRATNTTFTSFGVYGETSSNQGTGVFGVAPATTTGFTPSFGVSGRSSSPIGRGVYGYADSSTGTNYGVYGRTSSPVGYAGYFSGGRNYFGGNVGIGTDDPASPLHIAGTQAVARMVTSGATNGSVLVMQNDTASPAFLGAINFQANTGGTPGQISYSGGHDLTFRVYGFERMRIDHSGDVIVGNPAAHHMRVNSGSIQVRDAGSAAILSLNPGGTVYVPGDLGVGTSSPQYALDVNGEIRPQGGIYFNGAQTPGFTQGGNFIAFGHPGSSEDELYYYANTFHFADSTGGGDSEHPGVWAGDFIRYSDVRLKTDIEPIGAALALVKQIQGIRYCFDGKTVDPLTTAPNPKSRPHLGFAAQEVARVIPEAVHYAPETDVYGVSYGSLVPLLVEAIKEQQTQIESLQSQLAAVHARLDAMEKTR